MDVDAGSDPEVLAGHLTNVSLQRGAAAYNAAHGGKWPWENVLLYVASRHGSVARSKLVYDINFLIEQSLRAVQHVMVNDPHCFELYGYDVLVDDALRPWLIEINASPSMAPTTAADGALKAAVVSDVLDIVVDGRRPFAAPFAARRTAPVSTLPLNGFTCIANDDATGCAAARDARCLPWPSFFGTRVAHCPLRVSLCPIVGCKALWECPPRHRGCRQNTTRQ